MINLLIETERLNIKPVSIEDAPFILSLLNSESWIKYIGKRDVKTVEDAQKYIQERFIKHYETHGFGIYIVRSKDNNLPMGMCSLLKKPYLENVDIGYAFLDNFNGKGYAFEATKAVYDYAKTDLGMPRIVAVTLENNQRSIKLLDKLGFHFEQIKIVDSDPLMLFGNVAADVTTDI